MNNPGLIKKFKAGATIAKNRIVKFGADDNHVIQGAAVSDLLFGVADFPGPLTDTCVAEDSIDVVLNGVAEVKLGGTVTRGNPLTSDATGQALAAAPSAGVNNRIIGFAMASGVSGDIIGVLLNPGYIQG